MKKTKLLAILTVMITMLISVCVPAAVYDGAPDVIEITGGIDMEKKCEYTFNETRTITGKAESGTNIVIDVCSYDEDNVLQIVDSCEIEIGASGYFSKNLKLSEGKNIIVIGTDDSSANIVAHIMRKDTEIKNRLERGVYIPGSNISYFSI